MAGQFDGQISFIDLRSDGIPFSLKVIHTLFSLISISSHELKKFQVVVIDL